MQMLVAYERFRGMSGRIAVFLALQSLVEALLEDLIVVDRCLFLQERLHGRQHHSKATSTSISSSIKGSMSDSHDDSCHGEGRGEADVHLIPLFDPSLSPRSYAIVAVRSA